MMSNTAYVLSVLMGSPLATLSITALLMAIATLWYPTRFKLPVWFFIVYLIFGLFSGHLTFIALPMIVLLAISYIIAQKETLNYYIRLIAGIAAFGLSLLFFLHLVVGITNVKVIDHVVLSNHGVPFTMYFNLDKPLVGLFILFFGNKLIRNTHQWKKMLREMMPAVLIGFAVILVLSFLLGYITFDPKFDSFFYIWAIHNLFFTAITEEALCRGFALHYLDEYCKKFKYGQYISLLLVSIFFGALHYTGGWKYVLLATVAGIVYGRIYQKTQRIEASIIVHFILNTIHFLLFTYPALAD